MHIDQKAMSEMAFSIGQMTFVANNAALREMLTERGVSSSDLEDLKALTRKVSIALMQSPPPQQRAPLVAVPTIYS